MAVGKNEFSNTMRIDIPEDILDDVQVTPPPEKSSRPLPPPTTSSPPVFEDKYDELLHNIYDAAIITDLDGDILESNHRAKSFFTYTRKELTELNVLKLIANAEGELLDFIRRTLEEQRFVLIQAFCVRKNQTTFPVEIAVNLLHIPEPQLCFFIRDITERQRAEDALRESEVKFRTIFENSTDGISVCEYTFGTSPEKTLMDCNNTYVEMSGQKRNDLYEANLWDLVEIIEPSTYREIQRNIEQMRPYNGTYSWLRPDGKTNYIDFRAVPLRIGNRTYIYSIDRDVTEEKRAQEAIRKAEKQEAMLASVGAACHHLGQPATVLLTNLTLLQSGYEDKDHELVKASLDAAERIADILHKLNTVDEYKTIPYAQGRTGQPKAKILDI